jgi:hypothetical protein
LRLLCDRNTLGKLASRAQKVGVIDAERVIPGWKANGNPFVLREHFSRGEFASEIVDRLDYLCVTEVVTEKVMPLACLLWKGLGEQLLPRMCRNSFEVRKQDQHRNCNFRSSD